MSKIKIKRPSMILTALLNHFVSEVCKEYLYAEEYLPKAKDKYIKKYLTPTE